MARSSLSTEAQRTSQFSTRSRPIGGVVLHHGATTSADAIIAMEVSGSRQVSSHQVVKDSRKVSIVEEQFRAWSLSDAYWDSWALTVECANESTAGWTISAESHESLAQLVADWSRRYGFPIIRSGDPRTWTVIGHREVYTIHGGSYATACPGGMNLDWIANRAIQINTAPPARKESTMTINAAGRVPNGSIYVQFEPGCPFLPIGDINEWSAYAAATGATLAAWPDNPGILARFGTSNDFTKLAPSTHGATVDVELGDITLPADPGLVTALTTLIEVNKAAIEVHKATLAAVKALNPPG